MELETLYEAVMAAVTALHHEGKEDSPPCEVVFEVRNGNDAVRRFDVEQVMLEQSVLPGRSHGQRLVLVAWERKQ